MDDFRELILRVIPAALRLLAGSIVTGGVLLLLGLQLVDREPPPPVVWVVPHERCERCEEPTPAPARCEGPTPEPAAAPTTVNVFVEANTVTEWLGVVDIHRSELDHLLGSATTLARGVRVIPHEREGRVDGFRLYGIRRGDLLWAIGLRSGDTIHRINDRPLTSPDTTLAAYSSISRASHLDLRLTRQGRPARLVVVVHDGSGDSAARRFAAGRAYSLTSR
jgi:hypothetical protein